MITNSTLCQWPFNAFCYTETKFPEDLISKFIHHVLFFVIANGACYLIYIAFCQYVACTIISSANTLFTYSSLDLHYRQPATDSLTKSMVPINKWITKNKSRKLHTKIPDYPTESDQTKFSRLVLIELFVSFRSSRLKNLLDSVLLESDDDAIKRINAISSLVLLAFRLEPSETPSRNSLQNLVSAGLLMNTHGYVSQHLFLNMAPFDKTEKELMHKIGYDEKKHLYPAERKQFRSALRDSFIKKNMFMVHPYEKLSDQLVISKKSNRVLKKMGKMSEVGLKRKLKSIDKGLLKTETSIQNIKSKLFLQIGYFNSPLSDMIPGTAGEHETLYQIVMTRRKHLQYLATAEKIMSKKADSKWCNAIFEATDKGVPFTHISERVYETRVHYEALLAILLKFQKGLHDHEEKVAAWILERVSRRIPDRIIGVNPWDCI